MLHNICACLFSKLQLPAPYIEYGPIHLGQRAVQGLRAQTDSVIPSSISLSVSFPSRAITTAQACNWFWKQLLFCDQRWSCLCACSSTGKAESFVIKLFSMFTPHDVTSKFTTWAAHAMLHFVVCAMRIKLQTAGILCSICSTVNHSCSSSCSSRKQLANLGSPILASQKHSLQVTLMLWNLMLTQAKPCMIWCYSSQTALCNAPHRACRFKFELC